MYPGTVFPPSLFPSPLYPGSEPTFISMRGLNAKLQFGVVSYTNVIESDAGGTVTDALTNQILRITFWPGTDTDQADRAYRDQRTLPSTTSTTYTLSALPG